MSKTGEYFSIEIWDKCGDKHCSHTATHELLQKNETLEYIGRYCPEHILEFIKLNKDENNEGNKDVLQEE